MEGIPTAYSCMRQLKMDTDDARKSPKVTINTSKNTSAINRSFMLSGANTFDERDKIADFHPPDAPKPSPKTCYNGDVNTPYYSSAVRTHADKQRRGLQEEHIESLSMEEHVSGALSVPVLLAVRTTRPASAEEALSPLAHTPRGTWGAFGENICARCRNLCVNLIRRIESGVVLSRWRLVLTQVS